MDTKIEIVQIWCVVFAKHNYHNGSSITDKLHDLKWRSLEDKRRDSRLTMFNKIIENKVGINSDHHLQRPTQQFRSAPGNSPIRQRYIQASVILHILPQGLEHVFHWTSSPKWFSQDLTFKSWLADIYISLFFLFLSFTKHILIVNLLCPWLYIQSFECGKLCEKKNRYIYFLTNLCCCFCL